MASREIYQHRFQNGGSSLSLALFLTVPSLDANGEPVMSEEVEEIELTIGGLEACILGQELMLRGQFALGYNPLERNQGHG